MSILSRIAEVFNAARSAPGRIDHARVYSPLRTVSSTIITHDTAVTIPVVWACIRYLTQTVGVLPWHVMRDTPDGVVRVPSHSVDWLLHRRPCEDYSSFQFRETLLGWALRWGNGYAEIEPDQSGRPFALWPIHPERVDVFHATENKQDVYGDAIQTGRLYYEVRQPSGTAVTLSPRRMFHLRGFGEGPVGLNVVAYAAESLGWARAAQLFGASYFGNGMNASGVLKVKNPSPDGLKQLRKKFDDLYKGVKNANKVIFLDEEDNFQSISISPENAQFIETNQHLVEDVCRWFGVPPHKVMHLLRATFSNIEHQAIEVVVDSVTPWVKRFEDEADHKLFGTANRKNFYTKMNLRALLRGDFKSQNEGLQIARINGVINANEWREYLDMNRISEDDGGEKYIMQANNTTLDKVGEMPAATPAPAPELDEPEQQEPGANDDDQALSASLNLGNAILGISNAEPADIELVPA